MENEFFNNGFNIAQSDNERNVSAAPPASETPEAYASPAAPEAAPAQESAASEPSAASAPVFEAPDVPEAPGAYEAPNAYAAPAPCAAKAKPKKESGGKRRVAGVAALVLAASLLSGTAGAGAVLAYQNLRQPQAQTETASKTAAEKTEKQTSADASTLRESGRSAEKKDTVSTRTASSGEVLTAAEVYAQNVNSTVGVTTSITGTNYWGYKTNSAAAGSGFIVSEDGYIVTNYHVIEDGNSVSVTFYNGTSYDAEVVGYDASNDIAVLKVDAEDLTPVTLGDSDALVVGEDVVAIGNPLGELTFSLTKGTVSALDRTVTLSDDVTMNLIQTDAAINSGNSGGALFNMYGEVIGVTNAKYSSESLMEAEIDNIGFAIPMNSVKRIISEIIETGSYASPYLGVTVTDASDAALIYSVEKDTPAEAAGLQENDLVTAADGKKISSSADLIAAVKTKSPGETMTLTVKRDGRTLEIAVTVGEKPKETQQPQAQTPENGDDDGLYGQNGRPDRRDPSAQPDGDGSAQDQPSFDFGDLLPGLPYDFGDLLP